MYAADGARTHLVPLQDGSNGVCWVPFDMQAALQLVVQTASAGLKVTHTLVVVASRWRPVEGAVVPARRSPQIPATGIVLCTPSSLLAHRLKGSGCAAHRQSGLFLGLPGQEPVRPSPGRAL